MLKRKIETELTNEDFELIFRQLPGSFIVLKVDPPKFTILKVSDDLVKDSLKSRESFIGRSLFEYMSTEGDLSHVQEQITVLRNSFSRVLNNKKEDLLPAQRFDIIDPVSGERVQRYWSAYNKPIFNEQGDIIYIILYTQDISELFNIRDSEKRSRQPLVIQYQRILNFFVQAPVGIGILTGPDFIVELANPYFCKLIGSTYEEIINKSLFKAATELEDFGFRELLDRVFKTGKSYEASEYPLKMKRNGNLQEVYFNFVYEPVKESENTVSGIFIVATDVTEQVILRKKIEENEQRLKFCLEASNMGIWEIDLDTEITIRDFRHDEIFGYKEPVKEWNFEIFFNHVHPEDREYVKNLLDKAHLKPPITFEARIITPDGILKWIEVKGKLLITETTSNKLLGVISDITEKKMLELQKEDYMILLKNYNGELEELTNTKDKFISVISHDLKNPLSVIISSSDIILKNIKDINREETENFVRVINNSSKRVVKQLSELVEWSKSRSKSTLINPINKSLYECVNISMKLIDSFSKYKNVNIENQTPDDVFIYADPFMMQSIFQNLISNAIKYTPEGGSIFVRGEVKEKGLVKISVVDTGIGMSEELSKSIFDDNKMISTEGTKEEKGSGFGLRLVKEFVEKQGGTIWVESEPGKGSCFSFTIPQSKGNITSDKIKYADF